MPSGNSYTLIVCLRIDIQGEMPEGRRVTALGWSRTRGTQSHIRSSPTHASHGESSLPIYLSRLGFKAWRHNGSLQVHKVNSIAQSEWEIKSAFICIYLRTDRRHRHHIRLLLSGTYGRNVDIHCRLKALQRVTHAQCKVHISSSISD